MDTQTIPRIQQQPRTASETAIHYGYCAYKDINLMHSLGLHHRVQPPESPYFHLLPCRTLIPFTNIEVPEINEKEARTTAMNHNKVPPLIKVPKTAFECVREMADSYEAEGFLIVDALTGYTEDDAEKIFLTIQPFPYRLKVLQNQMDFDAIDRIAQTEQYDVAYGDEVVTMQPLPEHLKAVAEKVRLTMTNSAELAFRLGDDIKETTLLSLTNSFRGGAGKRKLDPHDAYLFNEFETKPPTIGTTEPAPVAQSGESQESIDLRKEELALRKEELAFKKAQLKVKYSKGDKVEIDGVEGEVSDTRFGRIKATMSDGTTKTL